MRAELFKLALEEVADLKEWTSVFNRRVRMASIVALSPLKVPEYPKPCSSMSELR